VTEDGLSSVSGNVLSNDAAGADAPSVFTSWSAGNAANVAALNTYGTLTLNNDGSWSYVLDNTPAATQALTPRAT
jgi:VCBS repeat-containing protein